MQLVLAIHSDRRQTEQIAALVGKRLRVEVVQATSAGEGFLALGDRIPDLILTSPLLSPFDEGVLDEYLRELGTAAAHIQTLRIPVMSAPEPSGGGLFSKKKRRPESTPDGCDPSFFVDEIAQYLTRAAEERRANVDQAHRDQTREMERALEQTTAPVDSYLMERADEGRTPIYSPEDSYVPAYQSGDDDRTPIYQADARDDRAPIYQADAGDDRAPIYQPEIETTAEYRLDEVKPVDDPAPVYEMPPVNEPAPTYDAAPAYEPPPVREQAPYQISPEPVAEPELVPEPEPLRSPYRFVPPATTSRAIYEAPPAPVATAAHQDAPTISGEPPASEYSSLILDPPRFDAEIDPPFVVHSSEERIPLSDSLERAAAALEASGLGEPLVKEVERVPMHRLSTLDEIPLPDELATRVERFHSDTPILPVAAPEPPTPIEEPIHIEEIHLAPEPVHVERPIAAEAPAPVEPIAPPAVEREPAKPGARRTPTFEAALAAIRKAWGKPRRSSSSLASPLSLNLHEPPAVVDPAPAPAPPPAPVVQPEPAKIEARAEPIPAPIDPPPAAIREVDLTVDVDGLEDRIVIDPAVVASPVIESVEAIANVTEVAAPVAVSAEEDVYELSASPALHDLDADLAAAGPPPPVREVFPLTAALAPAPAAAPAAAPAPTTSVEPPAGTPKRDKHRKKPEKRRAMKAQKPAGKPKQANEPAQDEWGLFDPNRCGFAALVDKLDEVTNEEKDGKPKKTSVRLISYG